MIHFHSRNNNDAVPGHAIPAVANKKVDSNKNMFQLKAIKLSPKFWF